MQSENTADRLKNLRAELGVSQKKMAGMFGVTPRTMANWESGTTMPGPALKLLENALTIFRVETITK